ncbi:MAG: hypothetical protein WC315_00840 [Candidatus Omnitrophota bacterium]|jgi:hypothetical protein
MRYRIISRENVETSYDFVNLTIAGFRSAHDACQVCQRIDILAYVMDTFTGQTLYENWKG